MPVELLTSCFDGNKFHPWFPTVADRPGQPRTLQTTGNVESRNAQLDRRHNFERKNGTPRSPRDYSVQVASVRLGVAHSLNWTYIQCSTVPSFESSSISRKDQLRRPCSTAKPSERPQFQPTALTGRSTSVRCARCECRFSRPCFFCEPN